MHSKLKFQSCLHDLRVRRSGDVVECRRCCDEGGTLSACIMVTTDGDKQNGQRKTTQPNVNG